MMKSTIFFLAFCLFALITNAQNFNIFDSTRAQLYKSNSRILYAIYLDSVVSVNNSSSKWFYNYKQDADDLGDLHNRNNMCKNYGVDTWLGERILYNGNGDYVFMNKENEVIIIKTDLDSGSWKMMDFGPGKYLLASIDTVLSNNSNLFINLKGVSEPMDSTFMNVDNKQIVISKELGFLKIFDFRIFPRAYNELQLYKSHNKLVFNDSIGAPSIFNYKVGDKMYYKGQHGWLIGHAYENSRIYRYIDVLEINAEGYKIRRRDYRDYLSSSYGRRISYTTNIIDIKYPINPELVLPFKRIKVHLSDYEFNNIDKYAIVLYETDSIFGRISRKHMVFSCTNSQDYPFQEKNYVQRIGVFKCHSHGSFSEPSFTYDTTLIYYKSDNIEWGDSVNLYQLYGGNPTTYSYNEARNVLNIYPNPVSENLFVEDLDSFEKVSIINSEGKITEEIINPSEPFINVEKYPSGLYLLMVNDKNGKHFSIKFFKK